MSGFPSDPWQNLDLTPDPGPPFAGRYPERMLQRLAGRRVLLVDDVISTGSSALAGLGPMQAAGMRPVGLCIAIIQTQRWQAHSPAELPLVGVCETPLLIQASGGWVPA